ncbi:unnamed protein product [Caenorhabditis brenneri]
MMNPRCLRLIAITILINCVVTDRLTDEKNQERIATCGKSELPTPDEGEKPEGSLVKFGDNSYIVRVQTKKYESNAATGFFISPRHILTSSQSVLSEDKQWLAGKNDKIEECVSTTMVVPQQYTNQIQVILDNRAKELMGIKSATLLCLEDQYFGRHFSPMLVELEKDQEDVQFPCVADSTTEVKVGDEVHAYRWQSGGKSSMYFKRKIEHIGKVFLETKKIQKEAFVRGGPLVMHKTPKRTVAIGIDATSGYKDDATHTYYHKIKDLEKDLCNHAGVCAPPPPPPITEATTTPEQESTTSNPDTQTSVDSSPSDTSGPSTPKPTEKPSVTSKHSTKPPQRTIDEYEVAPEDILYDEEKRRAQETDVNNDFFVSADFMTDSNRKSELFWSVGTLAMVLLV